MVSVKYKKSNKDAMLETYRWTSEGNLDNSGGIWPLNELLFMWLDQDWKSIIRIPIPW